MATRSPSRPTTGAARFAPPTLARPTRSPLQAVGAAVALLALVVGVPVALWLLAGPPPVPTSVPGREELLRPIGTDLLLDVLVLVVWLAWLQFVVSVLVEVVAALRGGVLARPVPLGGPSQRLARALVGALLLTATITGQATAAVTSVADAVTAQGPAVTSTAQQADDAADLGPTAAAPSSSSAGAGGAADPAGGSTGTTGAAVGGAGDGAGGAAPGAVDGSTAVAPELQGRLVYTVMPPDGRYHDNLWDIAERHLGDGRRYQEIHDLNAGRPQVDGRTLELARLIQPGWQLVMPEDAVGVPRVEAPVQAPVQVTAVPEVAVEPVGGATAGAEVGADVGAGSLDGATGGLAGSTGQGVGTVERSDVWAGGSLLAAALVAALVARRRSAGGRVPPELADLEVDLRVSADPERAALLDRGLRLLALRCEDLGRPLPGVYAVTVDAEELLLRLAPAQPDAPAPFEADPDGRTWRLAAAALPRGAAAARAPYPYLVGVGRDHEARDVLVDLASAGGAVALTGSDLRAGEVAAAMAVELAVNPFSAGLRLLLWQVDPAVVELLGERAEVVDALDDVLAVLRRGSGDGDVVSGARPVHERRDGTVLVLGAPVDAAAAPALAAAATDPGVAVLVVGDLPGARWRLHVDEAGSLSLDLIEVVVTANVLPASQAGRLAGLVQAAGTPAPVPTATGDPDLPPARSGVDDAAWPAAPARVGVLGPVAVRTPGSVDPDRLALVEEIVVMLALHPDGVHPSVLGASVWPRGVSAEVRDAAVARTRDYLGTARDGSYRLGLDPDGRLTLRDVVVDLDVVVGLLGAARAAADPVQEATLLRRALRFVRGEILQPRVLSRYTWLVRSPVERRTAGLVVDAAHRLACLERDSGDPAAASEAARAGLRADPAAALSWQDLLRAEHEIGGAPAVGEAATAMSRTLSALGLEPTPETVALLEDLDPRTAHA